MGTNVRCVNACRVSCRTCISTGVIMLSVTMAQPAQAWYRFYGNMNLAWQNTQTTQQSISSVNSTIREESLQDGSFRQTAFLNYEDSLFAKSTARLALNLDRREQTYTHRTEYRPIWYLDVNNPHFGIRSSFSDYAIKGIADTTIIVLDSLVDTLVSAPLDVHNREVRLSGATRLLRLPNVSVAFSRSRSVGVDTIVRSRSINTNVTADLSWFRDWFSIRGGHNRVDRREDVYDIHSANRSWNGTVALTKMLGASGSVASTYNVFRTRYASPSAVLSRSLTHSASTIVSTRVIKNVTGNVGYSGRFSSNDDRFGTNHDKSESFSSQLVWTPLSFLDLSALKAYQIDRERGTYQIMEYVTTSVQSSRYLRSGIDTRFSWSRTWYQQSSRERLAVVGADSVNTRVPNYHTDNWLASFDGTPFRYSRARYSATLSRDSDPIREDQKWQLTHSFDLTAYLTRKLDGRFTATAIYQGKRLRFGHVYSKSFNTGVNWSPRSDITLNASYTWSIFITYLRFVNSSLSGSLSYRFRRAFSFFFTANQQTQPSVDLNENSGTPIISKNQPIAINAQLQLFLTQRTTALVGYMDSRSEFGSSHLETNSQTWRASLNMQL
jgi:hypothetical protein